MDLALCSQCGYDLRGIASERCPECGYELALQTALGGEIPWTYRRARGRIRAFLQTVNKVSVGGPWLTRVIASPVSTSNARRFWLIAATIVALPLIAAFVYVWARQGDLLFVTYIPDPLLFDGANWGLKMPAFDVDRLPAWVRLDLIWPASAGWSRPGVAIVAIWLFVLFGTGAPTYLFHPRHLSETQRQRANAFSYYLVAPLVWATPALIVVIAAVAYAVEHQQNPFQPASIIAGLAGFIWILTFGLWFARLLKTYAWTTHAGVLRIVLAVLAVPLMWCGSAVIALGFVPWCVGTAWMLWQALER